MIIKNVRTTDLDLIIDTDEGSRKMRLKFCTDKIIAKCRDFKERQCLVEHSTFGDFNKNIWFSDIWEIKSETNTSKEQNYNHEASNQNISTENKKDQNDDGWEIDESSDQNETNFSKKGENKNSKDQYDDASKLPFGKEFTTQSSQKIYGPPGTGKTTALIEIVKKAIANGTKPEDIAFVAFTNEAANVAKERVAQAFPELGFIAFPNFSTIHAFSTKIGGTGGANLMEIEDFKAFDKNILCWKEWTTLGDATSAVARYRHPVLDAFSLSIARQEKMNYQKFCDDIRYKASQKGDSRDLDNTTDALMNFFSVDHENINTNLTHYCEQYIEQFLNYKDKNQLIGFDDVITKVANKNFPDERIPTFEVLIIDEAQDLSKHQWTFIDKLIFKAKETYVAGDDDQAIMIGLGSDPSIFVDLRTTEEPRILEQSYRVPKNNHSYVKSGIMGFINKLEKRAAKIWKPQDKNGSLGVPITLKPEITKNLENRIITETVQISKTEIDIETLLERVESEWGKFNAQKNELEVHAITEAISNGETVIFEPKSVDIITEILSKPFYIREQEYQFDKELADKVIDGVANNTLEQRNLILLKNMGAFKEEKLLAEIKISSEEPNKLPSWLIMSPSKGTGEKLSDALKEMKIPHFYRNKPIAGATNKNTLIRVQTIHISKGAEAENTAIVVATKGDVVMLAEDPRLAYVALTRAKKRMFPRVVKNGLFGEPTRWQAYLKAIPIYNQMFPAEFKM